MKWLNQTVDPTLRINYLLISPLSSYLPVMKSYLINIKYVIHSTFHRTYPKFILSIYHLNINQTSIIRTNLLKWCLHEYYNTNNVNKRFALLSTHSQTQCDTVSYRVVCLYEQTTIITKHSIACWKTSNERPCPRFRYC